MPRRKGKGGGGREKSKGKYKTGEKDFMSQSKPVRTIIGGKTHYLK